LINYDVKPAFGVVNVDIKTSSNFLYSLLIKVELVLVCRYLGVSKKKGCELARKKRAITFLSINWERKNICSERNTEKDSV